MKRKPFRPGFELRTPIRFSYDVSLCIKRSSRPFPVAAVAKNRKKSFYPVDSTPTYQHVCNRIVSSYSPNCSFARPNYDKRGVNKSATFHFLCLCFLPC